MDIETLAIARKMSGAVDVARAEQAAQDAAAAAADAEASAAQAALNSYAVSVVGTGIVFTH